MEPAGQRLHLDDILHEYRVWQVRWNNTILLLATRDQCASLSSIEGHYKETNSAKASNHICIAALITLKKLAHQS